MKLKPPKNFRAVTPKACATCKYCDIEKFPGAFWCERGGVMGNTEDAYSYVCDYYHREGHGK